MKEFLEKNVALVVAFALPIVLIAIIALSTYLPSLALSTDYDFVYSSCTDGTNNYRYNCYNDPKKRYSVVNGEIVDGLLDGGENYTARIFLHDTKKNEGREITLEEARALSLNELLTSPDGVTVSGNYNNRGGGFFIFDGGSSYGYYLTKGKGRSKLNLINSDDAYYYQGNFQFIGWVLPGRS